MNLVDKVFVLEVTAKASLPVLESCKAMGLRVVVGASRKHCCGMYSRAVDEKVYYPDVNVDPKACYDTILEYVQNSNVSVLIPCGDVMTDLIAQHQDEIRKYTKLLLPSYDIFVKGRNKVDTLKAAHKAGCPIPLTWYPDDEPLDTIIEKIPRFPVLIKPAISAGSRGITICNDAEEVISGYNKIKDQYGQSFIQEYVPQTGVQYKVDAVMDCSQELYTGVVYSKLRYYPPTGGSSVLNRTEYQPDILRQSVNIMKELKWVGICDFDFITDPRDGVVKLMEINPRFPESFRATVAGGVDMTKIICQLALGVEVEKQLDYAENKYNRFLFGDIMWFLKTKEDRLKAKPNFFDFFDKDTYYQIIRKNDLGPLLGYIMENGEMLWNRKLRKHRLR